ncbi:MAG: tRNA-specific adenosine deaminase [Pelagibacteraceae bacterium]|nr:tRNA-specific adenosine deaminase [Pelagibacteraceae bacterium]
MNINFFMKEAIKEANKALKKNEVPIGGLIVENSTKKIICRDYNKINSLKNAIYHCELLLISNACKLLKSKYLENASIFLTLEPCLMCTAALSEVHIKTIYFGAYNEQSGGVEKNKINFKKNKMFAPDVYGGINEDECKKLIKEFFAKKRKEKKFNV